MPATLRDQLISTQLFKVSPPSRDLTRETVCNSSTIRIVLSFDSFGDMTDARAFEVDTSMRDVVAQNRRALGLPSQENP